MIETFSPTALNMFTRCGEQFRRRYVEKEVIPPNIALLTGSVVHTSVEKDLSHKASEGDLLPVEQIKDIVSDQVEEKWREEIFFSSEEKSKGKRKLKEDMSNSTQSLSLLHHSEIAPVVKPKYVEARVEIEAEGYPVLFTGVIDCIADEGDDEFSIRDVKTASRRTSTSVPAYRQPVHTSLQLTYYQWAVMQMWKKPAKRIYYDQLVKKASPEAQSLVTHRTERDINVLFRRIDAALESIEKERFVPASPEDWVCNKDRCGYFRSCPYAVKPVSIKT